MDDRRLLIVEDDPDLAQLARLHLADEGFRVELERDGERALRRARREAFDLVVLDLMLPGLDGLEVCRALRREERYVPIIVVTARGTELDRILGLELGADDYMAKPISFRELVARVRAIFRRVDALEAPEAPVGELRPGPEARRAYAAPIGASRTPEAVALQPPPAPQLVRGDLCIDSGRRSVLRAGTPVELTAKEFELLRHFAAHPGRVFTRDELVGELWGPGYGGYEHTVNSHINRLRAKINGEGPRQRYIETVWGVGYRFAETL